MKAVKKPVEVEFFTFEEIVEIGKQVNPNSIHGERAWNFEFKGHNITHENDSCYIIPTLKGNYNFTPDDVLIVGVKGEIYPCKKNIFNLTYDVQITTNKTLHNTDSNGASKNVKDIVFWGDGDTFKLISKASSKNENWMKSTKAMEILNVGCVIQVTTQQGNNIAEALTFVPACKIEELKDEKGIVISRKIISNI